MQVNFYDSVQDNLLRYAVIASRHFGSWVLCKHKQRETFECPGGRREDGETVYETAKRELWEETGAVKYQLEPICVYAVKQDGEESFGMLFYADIYEFETLPNLEIEKIEFFKELPTDWAHPLIQPKLIERVEEFLTDCS